MGDTGGEGCTLQQIKRQTLVLFRSHSYHTTKLEINGKWQIELVKKKSVLIAHQLLTSLSNLLRPMKHFFQLDCLFILVTDNMKCSKNFNYTCHIV